VVGPSLAAAGIGVFSLGNGHGSGLAERIGSPRAGIF
jgi:hypothetical protein